jgi:hypothetical protein
MKTYGYLMSSGGSDSGHYVELLERKFHEILRCLLVQVKVDEDWYLSSYQDVRDAVRSGLLKSGREHYINSGYFENRFPRSIRVDEEWYLEEYPDVVEAIRAGALKSATEHFERDGFREGRLPEENWSLLETIPATTTSKSNRVADALISR